MPEAGGGVPSVTHGYPVCQTRGPPLYTFGKMKIQNYDIFKKYHKSRREFSLIIRKLSIELIQKANLKIKKKYEYIQTI